MTDVIVIGGGVIGLSIAWELAGCGLSVRVLEQSTPGREASWAGAGMLPPGNLSLARTAEARLRGATHGLWPEWSQSLTSLTGIDNGYVRCGAAEVRIAGATHDADCPLASEMASLRGEGVVVETGDVSVIRQRIPTLSEEIREAYFLPDFCQVRNPRHLKALESACAMRGVEIVSGMPVRKIDAKNGRIESVYAGESVHRAEEFVIATGAWSGEFLGQAGVALPVHPVKGQIVLLQATPPPFRSVIQHGREYLVPRSDGRILIGSTEENSGFDKRTTAGAIADLVQFAQRLVPSLKNARFEQCWAGLRPYSPRGLPYIGRLPQFKNAFVAAGHFRYGLHLSPITAILIRQILLKQTVLLPDECLLES